jgi:thioredoxin 1
MTTNELVTELNTNDFDEFAKKGLVFVDFFADWCMPCVMMAPVIEEIAENFSGKIKFGKVNVNDNEVLARKFNVSSIPNFVVLKDGKMVDQFVGAQDAEEIENRLREFL